MACSAEVAEAVNCCGLDVRYYPNKVLLGRPLLRELVVEVVFFWMRCEGAVRYYPNFVVDTKVKENEIFVPMFCSRLSKSDFHLLAPECFHQNDVVIFLSFLRNFSFGQCRPERSLLRLRGGAAP